MLIWSTLGDLYKSVTIVRWRWSGGEQPTAGPLGPCLPLKSRTGWHSPCAAFGMGAAELFKLAVGLGRGSRPGVVDTVAGGGGRNGKVEEVGPKG